MNKINDMEYRIFNRKMVYSFCLLLSLLFSIVNPGFGRGIEGGKAGSSGWKGIKPGGFHNEKWALNHPVKGISVNNWNLLTPPPTPIVATDDNASVNGYDGNSNLLNVFTNDLFNGLPIVPSSMSTVITTPASNSKIALDTATGIVSVAAGVPAGVYTIVYNMCDTADLSNCSSATVTVTVTAPVILASSDNGSVNGYNGSSNLLNVMDNDSFNALPTGIARIKFSIVTPASNTKVAIDTLTGIVSVAAGTQAGNYTIVYRICDTLNVSSCDTAIVRVAVTAPPLLANADYATVNSYVGNLNLITIYTNDNLNGTPVTSGRTNLTVLVSATDPGVILNTSNGKVSVFPMTPAGQYTFIYRLCDTLNTSNCDTAIVYIDVTAPPIVANADYASVNGYNGNAGLLSVFSNDSLNNRGTSLGSVTLTQVTGSGNPKVTLNTGTGMVAVAAGTAAGTYSIVYQICDTMNTSSCDTGLILIQVNAPVIRANADNISVNGYNGNASLINVLTNDSINGSGVNAAGINLSLISGSGHAGVTLNLSTGIVSVTPIVPAGLYTIHYKICDTLNTGNCDSALANITVVAPSIQAMADQGSVNSYNGSNNILNIFGNDSLNAAPLNPNRVSTTLVTPASHAGIVLDTATGIVRAAAGIPAGTYSLVYRICDTINTSNCDTAIVFISVDPPIIIATNDTAVVNGFYGATGILNVLTNDSINGLPLTLGAANLSIRTAASHAGVKLSVVTGLLSVDSLTPAGNYTIIYKICDTLNTSNCDTGIIYVQVGLAPIDAVNDTVFVNGYSGNPNVINVLANDSLNHSLIGSGAATISVISPSGNAGIVLNTSNGNVSVAPMIAAGTFTIRYRICDTLNPGNCDSGIVKIYTLAPPLVALSDIMSANGYRANANLFNVLSNDSINQAVPAPGAVVLTTLSPAGHPGITLNDTTGIIKISPRIPVGLYTISYKICDTLNPTNCDSTTDSIYITAPLIIAQNDTGYTNSYTGTNNLLSVLTNDSLDGVVLIPGASKLRLLTAASNPGITMNDTTGIIKVMPNTTAGIYTMQYQVCDTLNTTNCDTALAFIHVTAPLIAAINDTVTFNGYTGSVGLFSVLPNDSLNGLPVSAAGIKIREWLGSGHPNLYLDTLTGFMTALPGVPAGNYYIDYSIADTLNPGSRDSARLVIYVTQPAIRANADSVSINGYNGNLNLMNVLANDTFNNNVVLAGGVSFSLVVTANNPGVVLNPANGRLSVFPGTFAGLYHIIYKICDTLNPSNCDTAMVIVNVEWPVILAKNDTAYTKGYNSVAPLTNVLLNDSINHNRANGLSVNLNILVPFAHSGIQLDTANGNVNTTAVIPSGIYTSQYQICDTLNPGNCDTAWVTVFVGDPILVATNDTAYVNGYTGASALLYVLANDSINGQLADTGKLDLKLLIPSGNAGVVFDTLTGKISVLPNTVVGTYTMKYRIVDTVNTGNADTAFVVVYVSAANLVASNDTGIVNGYKGNMTLLNVLSNDSLNAAPVLTGAAKIKILIPAGDPGIVLDTLSGIISVGPRTPAGAYAITYQICDTLNPGQCKNAAAVIQVFAVGPVALQDSAFTPANTSIVLTPLMNDYDLDTNINIGSILVYPPVHGTVTPDPLTGTILYKPDTLWYGYDTVYYGICDSGMTPVLCDTSFIVVHVQDLMSVQSLIISHLSCNGDSSGMAILKVKGGFPPYTITWNTLPVQTGDTVRNLKAGTYQATVVDTMNATFLVNVVVTHPLVPIVASAVTTEPKCFGNYDGKITLTVSGGTTPYTYLWNNSNILKDLSGIAAGSYQVKITDSTGCFITKTYTLGQPTALQISATEIKDVICRYEPEGYILLNVSGGITPYKYLWSNGDTTADLTMVADGHYKITVTDSNACTAFSYFDINYDKEDCKQDVFVPNGFSPDGDGTNETFKIEGIEKYPNNHLRIYNRWGAMIYEKAGYQNTWKGTRESGTALMAGDDILPTGTYFYVLELGSGIKAISGYVFIGK